MHIAAGPQVIAMALSLAGGVVALVLLITKARGRSRVTGVVGAALILVGTLSGLAYRWLLTPHAGQLSDETLVGILAARTVIGSVLIGSGVVLLSCAIVVATRLPKKRRHGAASRMQTPPVNQTRR